MNKTMDLNLTLFCSPGSSLGTKPFKTNFIRDKFDSAPTLKRSSFPFIYGRLYDN